MDHTTDKNIDLFLQDVDTDPIFNAPMSVLYLLRRDVKQCLDSNIVMFPMMMALLAGIDLLAKFYKGSDDKTKVGERFKDFINNYFDEVLLQDSNTLYYLRNALMHSFGLYSQDSTKSYHFNLGLMGGQIVVEDPKDIYSINHHLLYEQFERAIQEYKNDLKTDNSLRTNFETMFPKYGTIYVSDTPSKRPALAQ